MTSRRLLDEKWINKLELSGYLRFSQGLQICASQWFLA
jgi:hypothetical protein